MNTDIRLLIGVLASPVIWFLNQETNFVVASLSCAHEDKAALYVLSGLSLAATIAVAGFCWNQRRQPEPNLPESVLSMKRALALGGAAISGLCALVILAQTIPILMLAGCK